MAIRANTRFVDSAAPRAGTARIRNLIGEIWDEVVTDECVDLAAQMSY